MSTQEMVAVYNDTGAVIEVIPRVDAEDINSITENVLVFIFNSKGDVWAQLRPQSKKHYPGLWDISACGGVHAHESHAQAAHREVFEEMGISPELYYVESFMNVLDGSDGVVRRRFSRMYVGQSDKLPKANDEVDEFKLHNPYELKEHIKEHKDEFIPTFLFELEKALAFYKEKFA